MKKHDESKVASLLEIVGYTARYWYNFVKKILRALSKMGVGTRLPGVAGGPGSPLQAQSSPSTVLSWTEDGTEVSGGECGRHAG